jgi:peptide/nickel transport system substrate-binding protein
MTATTALRLLVVLVATCFAAGCERRAREPAADDTLRIAMSTFSEGTFLPWNGSTGRKLYLDTIYEYLAYLDPETLEPRPGLAERWEVSADGMTYTFHIRRGVPFHEGWGELSAADVEYTLRRLLDPKAIAGPSSPLRKLIARIEVPDSHTLVLELTAPDIDFVRAYLSNGLQVPIVSKRYLEEKGDAVANAHPIGTGAFTLAKYRKAVSIHLRTSDTARNHWRVRPQFERIELRAVPEEFTRAAMLKTGEVDLAPVNYDSIKALRNAGLEVLFVANNWAPVIRLGGLVPRFRNESVPWQDRRVRQALNYAVDKQAIVSSIFHDHARPVGADSPAREWQSIEPYPYDPAKARALLAEAGYPDGFDITIRTYTTTPGAELPIIAEAVALYWQAIGVRVTIVPTNWISLRGSWTTGGATDIGWTHRGVPFSGTLAGLQASVMSASLFSSFANEETDARIEAIGAALDAGQRAALIEEFGLYLREQAAAVFIAFADEPYGASSKVGHWPALSAQGTNVDLISRKAIR